MSLFRAKTAKLTKTRKKPKFERNRGFLLKKHENSENSLKSV